MRTQRLFVQFDDNNDKTLDVKKSVLSYFFEHATNGGKIEVSDLVSSVEGQSRDLVLETLRGLEKEKLVLLKDNGQVATLTLKAAIPLSFGSWPWEELL